MKAKVPLAEIYMIQLELEGVTLTALHENGQAAGLETSVVCLYPPKFAVTNHQ